MLRSKHSVAARMATKDTDVHNTSWYSSMSELVYVSLETVAVGHARTHAHQERVTPGCVTLATPQQHRAYRGGAESQTPSVGQA